MRAIIFDVETSGLGPGSAVVEIGWQEVDDSFSIVDKDESLIDPQVPISASAAGVHGIMDHDVADSPTLEEYMTVVHEMPFMGEDVMFIAHNAKFDVGYLGQWVNVKKTLCSLKLARKLWPDSPDHKLQTLRVFLGLPYTKGDAHSAMSDVEVVRQLLLRAHIDFGLSLEQMEAKANEPVVISIMPFGKHKGTPMRDLPKSYREWALKNLDLDPDLRKAFETA